MAKVTEVLTDDFDRIDKWISDIGENAESDSEVYLVMGVLEAIFENGFPQELIDKKIDEELPSLYERLNF